MARQTGDHAVGIGRGAQRGNALTTVEPADEGNDRRPLDAVAEFRVSSNLDGPFDLTAGVFYERKKARFVGRVGGSFFGTATPTFDNHDNLTAYSAFLEAYYNITEKLKVTGGLRYTHEKKYHSASLDADAGGPAFSDGRTGFSNVSPRIVVAYDAGSVNYYASFNRGFKSGGFNSPTFGIDPPLKPETISAYEVGAKYRSPDGQLRVTTAAFHYDWKNVHIVTILMPAFWFALTRS